MQTQGSSKIINTSILIPKNVVAAAPSDESTETSEEDEVRDLHLDVLQTCWICDFSQIHGFSQQVAAQAPEEVNSDMTDSFSDTASVDSSDDDDDDVSKITVNTVIVTIYSQIHFNVCGSANARLFFNEAQYLMPHLQPVSPGI